VSIVNPVLLLSKYLDGKEPLTNDEREIVLFALYCESRTYENGMAAQALKASVTKGYVVANETIPAKCHRLEIENERLRASILNQAGDNLCWLQDPQMGRIPPFKEFLTSCMRFHEQMAESVGELQLHPSSMTMAQLERRCMILEIQLEEKQKHLSR
jgi:hypothetical protein